MTERTRIRRPRPWPVIASALAVFFAVLILIAFQSRVPPAPATTVAAAPPRQVIERRVIVTRVVTELRDDGRPAAPRVQVISVPVAPSSPAPAQVAPAPPASAPLTTRTS